MISRVIEAKPEELRVFLEEAAGVSKYKERRKETESRARATRARTSRASRTSGASSASSSRTSRRRPRSPTQYHELAGRAAARAEPACGCTSKQRSRCARATAHAREIDASWGSSSKPRRRSCARPKRELEELREPSLRRRRRAARGAGQLSTRPTPRSRASSSRSSTCARIGSASQPARLTAYSARAGRQPAESAACKSCTMAAGTDQRTGCGR